MDKAYLIANRAPDNPGRDWAHLRRLLEFAIGKRNRYFFFVVCAPVQLCNNAVFAQAVEAIQNTGLKIPSKQKIPLTLR